MKSIDFFDRGWRLNPTAPVLISADTGETYSYDDVRSVTMSTASALHKRGFGVGSRVAVLGSNGPAEYTAVLSILRSGATWIPTNPRNAPQDNAQMLNRFDCDALFFKSEFEPYLGDLKAAAPNISEFISIDRPVAGASYLPEWSSGCEGDIVDVPTDPELVYCLFPTGGTTGLPKGVMSPNRAVENIVANFTAVAPCVSTPVFLAAAPLTHAAGTVMHYIMSHGGHAVVMQKPDRAAILAAFEKYKVTHTFLPPTIIYDLLAQPNVGSFDYSSLQYLMYGGAPMSGEKLREAIKVFGPCLAQIYGQVETAVPNLFMSPQDHFQDGEIASDNRLSACGRRTPFTDMAVMSEDGDLLPAGEIGEIVARGAGIMRGYYKNPEATAEATRNGWHLTGDVGYFDEDQMFYLVDRKKDMIISGGFNIFPAEIERAILTHPDVQDCAVIGVPDPKWGEAVKAVVELKAGANVTEDAIRQLCRSAVGSMKTPKSVDFIDLLPRSAVGKVLKRELREKYWQGQTRMVS